MKKFGLFISIALLTAFVGCDSDDVEDPVVPAVSKPVVAVSENTPTSFGVEWDAVDEAAGYQYVVTESDAAGNTSEFCPETQTDKTSLRFDDAAAGAKYTVKVKALAAADSQLADSEYAEIFVETPAEGLSSQTFAFTVDPVGYDSATVKVEPSIADETYFFAVVKSSLLLDKNSNAIIEMLKKDIEPESLIKGEQTIETKWLDPETAYVAVAFGYDADRGASTSVLSRSEKFSTAVDPRMSIDVSVMNAGDEAISAKCVPSGSGSYFVTAVKSADVAGMSDREILDAQLAALNAEIDKSGWDAVAAAQFRSGTSNYNASGLSIGTEYSVVAFGVQKSAAGKAEETTRLFKANTKTTSPEAKVQLTYVIDDGDKYVYVDPDFAGKAVMLFDLVPNEATAKWAVGLFYETVLEMPEADIIAFMLGDPANLYTDALTDRVVPLEWGEVLYVTTIGVNAAGVTGPLSMTRVEAVMDGNQGGGDEPTPPTTERSNASVGLSNSLFNDEGNPAAQITFSPNSDCASFRFMIGYGPGLVEEAGEEAMIAAFGDESLNMSTNPEGLWYDSSVLQGSNGAVFTFVKDALGATVCNYALAYDAEGVPGKISVDTMQFPASLDDLPTSPSSAPTSSMMFHTRYRHLAAIELMDRTSRLKVSNLK
ncbi:fibronectin type III domain-containing protein [Alistipes communis]|jgi:lipoprotein|uniref:fibronectin type III domain-containing protein n=1 Tax=Alistipes communis TaxID=2585118 RepID=UPI001B6D48AF|nr:fibronectin type III domain-containing protein [Alistipes communis]MBP6452672.1 fibronectin type III domain-containing protein [Alistipes sp.]